MITIELNVEYTITGAYGPNRTGGYERLVQHISFFETDYGRGMHCYVRGHKHIEVLGSDGLGPAFGDWQDGHPGAVAQWAQRIVADDARFLAEVAQGSEA